MKSKKIKITVSLIAIFVIIASVVYFNNGGTKIDVNSASINTSSISENEVDEIMKENNLKVIYLAGGCFWGVEEFFQRIEGVYDVTSGYANGSTENPTYEEVSYENTGHAETVRVLYDPFKVSLTQLLDKYFVIIDPVSVNKQGGDTGVQYRTGIYYTDELDRETIDKKMEEVAKEYDQPLAVEVSTLDSFYLAEDYHQDYLKKNPNGYCHINLNLATEDNSLVKAEDYNKIETDEIKNMLDDTQYYVTQSCGTEAPFSSEYDKFYEAGIYVDVVTGEPLFSSTHKYDSGSGWPSFTQPITPQVVTEGEGDVNDYTGLELKSRVGESHLGHVFSDGPEEDGGLRYCINGASLKFIPYEEMEEAGYGDLMHLVEIDE